MIRKAVVVRGTSVRNAVGGLDRNLVLTIGRPVGANGEGLGGCSGKSEKEECEDTGRSGELSAGAQSGSEPPPPSEQDGAARQRRAQQNDGAGSIV